MDKEVVLDKLKLPSGVSRSTHFLAITKDLQVVAIKKDASMIKKANETRKAKSKEKLARLQKKVVIESAKMDRAKTREKVKAMREELKKIRANAKAEADAKRKALIAEIKSASKKK